ncbi:MAG: hypothetical protein Q8J69_03715 [Sphingobacteriaceae bacterium]|nr:hypothetical protein [Sphingobacteriaceae bacterium]
MAYRVTFAILLLLLFASCKKEPIDPCLDGGCIILEGRLWDDLNNRGAPFVHLQFIPERGGWWNAPDFQKFQTDGLGYFSQRVPKKQIFKNPGNQYALRCIDDGYLLQTRKYIYNDFILLEAQDNALNQQYTVRDTVVPVGLIDFHFLPSSTRQIIQFNYNLNNYWRMGPLLIDINQSPYTTYRLPVPLRDNQPIWVSYHGTVNNVPFGDSSYIELKHRQHIQIAPLQP